jgi:hypothetical protein
MRSDLIEIAVVVRHETEKAWLVDDGTKQVWLPKSRVEVEGGVLTIPESLAKEKELI